MSTRNQAINRLVQGTGLYETLNRKRRQTLVAMLTRAYLMGQRSTQKEGSE